MPADTTATAPIQSTPIRPGVWAWLAVAAVGLFLLFTIQPGQRWDGDSELYIMDALNILHGHPYTQTPYLVNPVAIIHPASYPPGLPLLMAPVLALFGINYVAIKVMLVLFLIATLAVMAVIARQSLSAGWTIFFVLALGLNPYLWEFKNTVYSEFPFLLFLFLGLWLFDRVDQIAAIGVAPPPWTLAVLSGACFGLAYTVRSIGFLPLGAVIALTAWRIRRLHWLGAAVVAAAIAVGESISHIFPVDNGAYQQVAFREGRLAALLTIPARASDYLHVAGSLFSGSHAEHWGAAKTIAALIVLALIVAGLLRAIFQRLDIYPIFFIFYLAFVIFYPVAEEPNRYALPLLPLAVFYVILAAEAWPWRSRAGYWIPACLAALFAVLYIPEFAHHWRDRPGDTSIDGPMARQMYEQVKQLVPPEDLVLCYKPTVIALYTGRQATNPPRDVESPNFDTTMRQFHPGWFVDFRQPIVYPGSIAAPMSARFPLELRFENGLFAIYRVLPASGRPPAIPVH